MREEESNWFSRWDEQLPSPDELMPLSQTLITPDLALAFDIRNPNTLISNASSNHHHHLNGYGGNQYNGLQTPPPLVPPLLHNCSPGGGMGGDGGGGGGQTNICTSSEFDTSGDLGSGGGVGGDENARTLKRPRLVWTPQLHKRFVDAVAHLGIKNAVPKTIMQLMSVDGLTRENVASHLQKYRLYLKRMQGLSSGGGNGGLVSSDPSDHLFASTPVPAHFLHPGRGNSDHFMPFVPVTPLQQHQHHHQQHVAHPQLQLQQQFHQHQRQVGHFGSTPNGYFDNPYSARQSQQPAHRMGGSVHSSIAPSYIDDLESDRAATEGRKILTLFPTGDA